MINLLYIRCFSRFFICNKNNTRLFYDVRTKNDTIYAPATAQPLGAKGSPLGVIRISGPQTSDVISRLTNFRIDNAQEASIDKLNAHVLRPRRATLAKINKLEDRSDILDVGLIIWFPKPDSFTGEDVCEFHLHGSQAIMRGALDQLGQMIGLRPAEPGEFSRRAVINKKMSLIQAESLPDLIASRTEKQRKLALRGLEGHVIVRYELWLEKLVRILAHLEASIDFGEDELIGEKQVVNDCLHQMINLSNELNKYIRQQARSSNYIRNGIKIAIMGRPNVGKSSLMNKLCQTEKSIVSNVSGTTRDVVEQSFELGGHCLTLCDTAGLRDIAIYDKSMSDFDNHDLIEKEGIKRALIEGSKADMIIYVMDLEHLLGEESIHSLTEEIFTLLNDVCTKSSLEGKKQRILYLILNKIDTKQDSIDECAEVFKGLVENIEDKIRSPSFNDHFSVISSAISCKFELQVDSMIEKLSHQLDRLVLLDTNDDNAKSGLEFVNERHLSFLRSCQKHVQQASTMDFAKIDQMAQHVREATDYLSRCMGSVTNDQILDIVFKDFCIGK